LAIERLTEDAVALVAEIAFPVCRRIVVAEVAAAEIVRSTARAAMADADVAEAAKIARVIVFRKVVALTAPAATTFPA
jgi:hypothetical protein